MNAFTQLHMQSLGGAYSDLQPPADSVSTSSRTGLKQYKKQLIETRSVMFQKHAMKMLTGDESEQIEARRQAVLKRVTREFWTNFVVRGEDTAMLRHLQQKLRDEFGEDLQFYYPPGDVQMMILHDTEDGLKPVEPHIHAAIVNRAWQLARDLVASHMA